jgi:hypothetical protein
MTEDEEESSPLLALLEELPIVFRTEVLPRLDVVDTYLLEQASRATRAAVKDAGFTFSLLGGFLRQGLYTSIFQLINSNISRDNFLGSISYKDKQLKVQLLK